VTIHPNDKGSFYIPVPNAGDPKPKILTTDYVTSLRHTCGTIGTENQHSSDGDNYTERKTHDKSTHMPPPHWGWETVFASY
jgi:hypothetical protein